MKLILKKKPPTETPKTQAKERKTPAKRLSVKEIAYLYLQDLLRNVRKTDDLMNNPTAVFQQFAGSRRLSDEHAEQVEAQVMKRIETMLKPVELLLTKRDLI